MKFPPLAGSQKKYFVQNINGEYIFSRDYLKYDKKKFSKLIQGDEATKMVLTNRGITKLFFDTLQKNNSELILVPNFEYISILRFHLFETLKSFKKYGLVKSQIMDEIRINYMT